MIIRSCIVCGNPVKVSPSQEKAKKCCSLSCIGKWRSSQFYGDKNPAYKGGKVLDKNGYVRIRGSCAIRQYEHRFIMEQYLGRKLTDGEEVHHINGDKIDNRLENLYLVDKQNHSRAHFNLFLEVQKLEWENRWLKEELGKYTKISYRNEINKKER